MFLSDFLLFRTIYLWFTANLKIYSLTKSVFRLNFFVTYFAWNRYFLIFEWFQTIYQHTKVQETVIRAKHFTTKWKVLIKMAQGIRKNNDTILWLPLHKKMKFSIKDLFGKCDQIRSKLWIWSYLLKKSLKDFLCYVPNREGINYNRIPLKVFCEIFR